MARQQSVARKQSRSKRTTKEAAGVGAGENGSEDQVATDEQELASYLEERIKPGLNRGSIPLVARSIASEIAREEYRDDPSKSAEADEGDDASDLETNLHKLQSQ